MNLRFLLLLALTTSLFVACDDDDMTIQIDEPASYAFERDGESTVDFNGQTTRLFMAEELIQGMLDFSATEDLLLARYSNQDASGGDVDPFENADLNASTKSVRSKVAASTDFFSSNTAGAAVIKAQFEAWISAQVTEVYPNQNVLASVGQAGQIADGTSTRYINAQGVEYNQLVNKGLIGAIFVDQILNNYLSEAVLDEGNNVLENDNGTTADGKSYTIMEHKWDEAYGYIYGLSVDAASPNLTIGDDDSFLNKYIASVDNDPDFKGITEAIYNAFKLGRAAIVAGDYTLRNEQIAIIREQISIIVAARAVHYLQQAKFSLNLEPIKYGTAFHDLSEAYGFIYSLQFTRQAATDEPYFSKEEVRVFLTDLLSNPNGFWSINTTTLDELSDTIAERFDFTVEEAAN